MQLSFTGLDALNIATAANRLPEVFDTTENQWRPARALPEARRLLSMEPASIRLVCDARILLEDIGKIGINRDADLLATAKLITAYAEAMDPIITALQGNV